VRVSECRESAESAETVTCIHVRENSSVREIYRQCRQVRRNESEREKRGRERNEKESGASMRAAVQSSRKKNGGRKERK